MKNKIIKIIFGVAVVVMISIIPMANKKTFAVSPYEAKLMRRDDFRREKEFLRKEKDKKKFLREREFRSEKQLRDYEFSLRDYRLVETKKKDKKEKRELERTTRTLSETDFTVYIPEPEIDFKGFTRETVEYLFDGLKKEDLQGIKFKIVVGNGYESLKIPVLKGFVLKLCVDLGLKADIDRRDSGVLVIGTLDKKAELPDTLKEKYDRIKDLNGKSEEELQRIAKTHDGLEAMIVYANNCIETGYKEEGKRILKVVMSELDKSKASEYYGAVKAIEFAEKFLTSDIFEINVRGFTRETVKYLFDGLEKKDFEDVRFDMIVGKGMRSPIVPVLKNFVFGLCKELEVEANLKQINRGVIVIGSVDKKAKVPAVMKEKYDQIKDLNGKSEEELQGIAKTHDGLEAMIVYANNCIETEYKEEGKRILKVVMSELDKSKASEYYGAVKAIRFAEELLIDDVFGINVKGFTRETVKYLFDGLEKKDFDGIRFRLIVGKGIGSPKGPVIKNFVIGLCKDLGVEVSTAKGNSGVLVIGTGKKSEVPATMRDKYARIKILSGKSKKELHDIAKTHEGLESMIVCANNYIETGHESAGVLILKVVMSELDVSKRLECYGVDKAIGFARRFLMCDDFSLGDYKITD